MVHELHVEHGLNFSLTSLPCTQVVTSIAFMRHRLCMARRIQRIVGLAWLGSV
jgi:hypothetical protein